MRTESQTFLSPLFLPTPLKKKEAFHSLQSHGYLTGSLSPLTPEAEVTVVAWVQRQELGLFEPSVFAATNGKNMYSKRFLPLAPHEESVVQDQVAGRC